MKKRWSLILALAMLFGIFNFNFTASAVLSADQVKIGDPLGDVLYSDIVAYINGYAIPTSVKSGATMVVVEDLANYGFNVSWNGANRSLKVEPARGKTISPLPVVKDTKNKPGAFKCKYLYTDIKTYLSGELVPSFAIGGVTLIDFELLARYGKLSWNGNTKELRLITIVPVESVKFGEAQKTVNRYEKYKLNPAVLPADATNKILTYKTNNPSVATVSNSGEVYAAGAGTAIITGISDNGIQASCAITVVVPVSAIYIETDRYRYKTGETVDFKVIVYPEDATDKSYAVNVAGSGELSGDNKIFCMSSGITTITAAASSNMVSGKKDISVIDLYEFSAEVLRLTNIERQKYGLPDLSHNGALRDVAFIRAKELVTLYSHTRPNGKSCFTAYEENHIDYWAAGENIACGQSTPEEVVKDWMNSPGHRENILDRDFGRLGVGVEMDSKGRLYWSQNFTD